MEFTIGGSLMKCHLCKKEATHLIYHYKHDGKTLDFAQGVCNDHIYMDINSRKIQKRKLLRANRTKNKGKKKWFDCLYLFPI